MHPVESFTYFTCVFTPLLFTAHPVHFLFIKLHADISPIPGHHVTSNDVCLAPASPTCETRCAQGYQSGDPSGQGKAYLKGQQFHWLHHHYFECNCTPAAGPSQLAHNVLKKLLFAADGSDLVPCDHIFGTYRKDSLEIARVAAPSDAAQAARKAAADKAKAE